jgi:integrase
MPRHQTSEPGHSKESASSPLESAVENLGAKRPKSGGQKLTDTAVKDLVCPAGKKDALFFDAVLKGFGIRVMPDRADGRARKIFLFQYRAGDKVRREPLGEWGAELTAGQARRKAETLRGAVRDRRDPVAERKATAAAIRSAVEVGKRAAEADAFTLGKLVDAWEARALSLRRPGYSKEATTRVRQGLADWLTRPVTALTRSVAAAALQEAAKGRGAIAGNRLLAYSRACFGWGIKADLVTVNPFLGLAQTGRERARDRVLTEREVSLIWRACDGLENPQQAYVRFLLLTLQRRSEVAGARWSEMTGDMATWTIPAERAKNGRAHLVHLAPTARDVLKGLTRAADQPLVFALPGGTQITAFSVIKKALDVTIAKLEVEDAAEEGREPVTVPGWTFHDFRRTGVTVLANQGTPPHVADRLLNHVSGSIQGVAAVYQRAEFLAERKAALEAWAEFVTECGSGD